MKNRVSIKDLARELNVSPSTISRALQDHPDISKATKDAVRALAEKYHYRPNAIALSLRMKHTNIIGVLVPEIVHHFFSSVFAGIEAVANEQGYNVIICQTGDKYEKEVKNIDAMISARAAGVLASLSKETVQYEHFRDLLNEDIPLVFFDRICPGLRTDRVIADDYTGAYSAVDHLLNTGCKRIAFYGSSATMEIARNRKNGYIDALKAHRIPLSEDLVFECDSREAAIEITPKLLQSDARPDAFFAINDDTASGILYAVKHAGLRIPDDIAICGFGDGDVAIASDPALTTVRQDGYTMGMEACKLLLNRIKKNDSSEVEHKVVRTQLVLRQSTR